MASSLVKFSKTFYKSKSAGDAAQVVAASATVSMYRVGATVTSGATVTTDAGGTTVTVRDRGAIAVDDTVQVGTDTTKQMICVSVSSRTSIKLRSTIGSSIALTA